MKALKKAGGIFDCVNDALAVAAGGLFVFITLATSAEVVMRYFLNRPTLWTLETAEYSILFITFFAAAWVLRGEGHVSMDILPHRLNPQSRALLNMVTSIFGAILCLAVTWFGAAVTLDHFQRHVLQPTVLAPPKYVLLAVIPIGFFLLFVQFLIRAYGFVGAAKRHDIEQGR